MCSRFGRYAEDGHHLLECAYAYPKLLGLQPYGQGSALPVGASGNGNQKGYRVNVDGSYLGSEAGFQTQNVEIRKGDSIRVFVELTSAMQNSEEPQLVSDNLVFVLESGVEQKVNLRAFSWDAMKLNSLEVKQDQLLESTLPVVVYGGIRVDEAATLTIAPGTQLYFHENAGLQVFGSLKIEGERTGKW